MLKLTKETEAAIRAAGAAAYPNECCGILFGREENGDHAVADLGFEIGSDVQRQQLDHAWVILPARGVKGLGDGRCDLCYGEVDDFSIPLLDLIHVRVLPSDVRRVALPP